jgi:hypothetical protein
MYYEGGVSSVYLWDLDDGGFAGVVLLKKSECLVLILDPIQVGVYLSWSGRLLQLHVWYASCEGREKLPR